MRVSKLFTQLARDFCYTRSFLGDKWRFSIGLYAEIGSKSSYNVSYARSFRTNELPPPVATRMVLVSHCQIELYNFHVRFCKNLCATPYRRPDILPACGDR